MSDMVLFFDTETTGKVDFALAPEHPSQPRLVQLAAALADREGNVKASVRLLICPTGWEVPEGARNVHGISTEDCIACGVSLERALAILDDFCCRASLIVAHNINFDMHVVHGEYTRIGFMDRAIGDLPSACTMKLATDVCKLPGRYGNFKWPSLKEAHRHLTGEDFDGAHDAMADVMACLRCWVALNKREVKAEPAAV